MKRMRTKTEKNENKRQGVNYVTNVKTCNSRKAHSLRISWQLIHNLKQTDQQTNKPKQNMLTCC